MIASSSNSFFPFVGVGFGASHRSFCTAGGGGWDLLCCSKNDKSQSSLLAAAVGVDAPKPNPLFCVPVVGIVFRGGGKVLTEDPFGPADDEPPMNEEAKRSIDESVACAATGIGVLASCSDLVGDCISPHSSSSSPVSACARPLLVDIDSAVGCCGCGCGTSTSGIGVVLGGKFWVLTLLFGRDVIVLFREEMGDAGLDGKAGGEVGLIDSNMAHPPSTLLCDALLSVFALF